MEKLTGSIYLIGGFTLAGTSVVAARFVSQSLGTFTITAVSLLITILGLLLFFRRRTMEPIAHLNRRTWLALLFQAACGIFLFRMFLIQGLLRTSTVEAGVLTGITPAATALLAVFLLKEPVKRARILGVASTVAGIVFLQGTISPGSGFSTQHLWGNVLVMCAAICEAFFNVFSRITSRKEQPDGFVKLDPIRQTLWVAVIAFILCLIPSLFEQPWAALSSLGVAEWLALGWYGLFVTALAFIFFYAGIRRCSASTAAVLSGMMPFTSMLLSVLILGEAAGPQQWLGGAMIVIGMVLSGK